MPQEVIDWLFVSSLIFFNIFCFVGIIALLVITFAVLRIREKAVETMNIAQQTTTQVGKAIEENSASTMGELLIFLAGLILPLRKETLLQRLIKSFLR